MELLRIAQSNGVVAVVSRIQPRHTTIGNYRAPSSEARGTAVRKKISGPSITPDRPLESTTFSIVARSVLFHGKLETTLRTLAVFAAFSHRRTDGFAEQHFDRTANFRVTAHGGAEWTAEASNP